MLAMPKGPTWPSVHMGSIHSAFDWAVLMWHALLSTLLAVVVVDLWFSQLLMFSEGRTMMSTFHLQPLTYARPD